MPPLINLILHKGIHDSIMATSLISPSLGVLVAVYLRHAIQHLKAYVGEKSQQYFWIATTTEEIFEEQPIELVQLTYHIFISTMLPLLFCLL